MKRLRITVDGRAYDVTVEVLSEQTAAGAVLAPTPTNAPPVPQTTPAVVAHAAGSAGQGPSGQAPVGAGAIVSPMAGAVKEILVQVGAQVAAGQGLVVLEAMKMDNQIASPSAGRVKSIAVKAGDAVHEGQVLAVVA